MPKILKYKVLWVISILCTGYFISFSRVAVGAHHPLDVISGSIIGYISGISGILISRKYEIWSWIGVRKYYPIFMILILAAVISIISKITYESLIVFYLAIIALLISLYKIVNVYVKK